MNVDFDGSRKEFWGFVGRRMKGKKKITSLKSNAEVSVMSTRGKLKVLQSIWGKLVILMPIGKMKLKVK